MSLRSAGILLPVLVSTVLAFGYLVRQVSVITMTLSSYDEVDRQLRRSLDDQKNLARHEPHLRGQYRQRAESIAALVGHLRILSLSRVALARQIELVLAATVISILLAASVIYLSERRARHLRLARLEGALEALARGDTEIHLSDGRRDLIGRIAASIEANSRIAARGARRLRYLENLSMWQEAARRHAHEIRTPLTAARMELDRLVASAVLASPDRASAVEEKKNSILEELDHLRDFTRNFTSFARIGVPRMVPVDFAVLLRDFCSTFARAWPLLDLQFELPKRPTPLVAVDREMIRQVLTNLCNNSALARTDGGAVVSFRLMHNGPNVLVDVLDNGPGIAPEMQERLFEPYATTRPIGEGMGLGLAISKKILLDHGGDLELVESSPRGTRLRLSFPPAERVNGS